MFGIVLCLNDLDWLEMYFETLNEPPESILVQIGSNSNFDVNNECLDSHYV